MTKAYFCFVDGEHALCYIKASRGKASYEAAKICARTAGDVYGFSLIEHKEGVRVLRCPVLDSVLRDGELWDVVDDTHLYADKLRELGLLVGQDENEKYVRN